MDIFVINLDERTDRWDRIQKDFGKMFNLVRVSAIKHENGWIGCLLSHKKCVQYAKDNNMKYIIVVEDDCDPLDNIDKKLLKLKEEIFDVRSDWDIYIGSSTKTSSRRIEKYVHDIDEVYKINWTRSAFFIIYNYTSYDFFLNSDNNLPIDVVWYEKLKCIMSIPFICSIHNGFSNIAKTYTNVRNIVELNEKKLLNIILK